MSSSTFLGVQILPSGSKVKWKSLVVFNSLRPYGLNSPWNSLGQNTGVGSLSLLQGIFPTQGSNPDLPHYRLVLYQLSHKGSPRILEWITYPFSSRSSQPRNQTGVSRSAGWFLTNWAIREAPFKCIQNYYSLIRYTIKVVHEIWESKKPGD